MTGPHTASRTLRAPLRLYHGTRADLKPGELIHPCDASAIGEQALEPCVYLAADLDAALWASELAVGEGRGRVYVVEPTGSIEDDRAPTGRETARHPSMSWRSRDPLRVTDEVRQWTLYHGTRADLQRGDLITPGHVSNYGKRKNATYVYLTATLDAATWGAELAIGKGPGRIYTVEATGPIEDDPDLTNKKFRGNPTKSYRSLEPLRVTGEVTEWRGHSHEALKAMKDSVERLRRLDVENGRQ